MVWERTRGKRLVRIGTARGSQADVEHWLKSGAMWTNIVEVISRKKEGYDNEAKKLICWRAD
jgi:hypothetical protein